MSFLETTRLSSKGQVVLPQAIRQRLHLTHGVKFVVMGRRDTVILKRIAPPSIRGMKHLLQQSQQYAGLAGLRPSDIRKAVRRIRKRSNRGNHP